MNPLIRLLMTSAWGKGVGDRFGGSQTSDFKNLTDAYKSYKDAAASGDQFSDKPSPLDTAQWPHGPVGAPSGDSDKSPMGPLTPMDRIKAAFDSLKDMHKPEMPTLAQSLPQDGSSPFDNAQWPYGPVGAPSQAQAQGGAGAGVPMPRPRPAEAQQADQGPMMSLFQRSAALQKDPLTGEFIDPINAAKAQPNIFKGLFG